MALNVFKGIEQVTETTYLGLTDSDKIGKLYLVKRTDGYGDIYFGTRHYGHFSQAEIVKLAKAVNDIDANKAAIAQNTSDITTQRTEFNKLVSLVDSMVKYEYKETANVPEGVTPVSKDEVPSTVGKTDPEYITVNGKNYHKEVVSTSEVLDSLKKMINDVDAKFESYKVKTVAEGDKVLSVNEQGVLSSTMSLKYDSTNKKITLYGGSEDPDHKIGEVDTTDFIKDGMLETAELVTVRTEGNKLVYGEGEGTQVPESVTEPGKYIRLHFNTDSSANDIFLSVNDLVDVYKGGKDITVKENNTIDVTLGESITVSGGPLADDVTNDWPVDWKDNVGNKIIPSGKSLTEILTGLFLKVVNGTLGAPSYSWNPTQAAPGASASPNGTVEVGAEITVSGTTTNSVSGNNASATVNASQGYFIGETRKDGDYTQTVSGTVSGEPVLGLTWNNTTVENGAAVTAVEGSNTLSVVQTGLTAAVPEFKSETLYASTNTKAKVDTVSQTISATGISSREKQLSSSAKVTVQAYYPIYTNGISGATTDTTTPVVTATDDSTKLPLVADNKQFGVAFASQVDGGTGYRILLQSEKSIKTAMALNGFTSKYDIPVKDKFVKNTAPIEKASGKTVLTYYAWEYKGTEGANRVIFTIGK